MNNFTNNNCHKKCKMCRIFVFIALAACITCLILVFSYTFDLFDEIMRLMEIFLTIIGLFLTFYIYKSQHQIAHHMDKPFLALDLVSLDNRICVKLVNYGNSIAYIRDISFSAQEHSISSTSLLKVIKSVDKAEKAKLSNHKFWKRYNEPKTGSYIGPNQTLYLFEVVTDNQSNKTHEELSLPYIKALLCKITVKISYTNTLGDTMLPLEDNFHYFSE